MKKGQEIKEKNRRSKKRLELERKKRLNIMKLKEFGDTFFEICLKR